MRGEGDKEKERGALAFIALCFLVEDVLRALILPPRLHCHIKLYLLNP